VIGPDTINIQLCYSFSPTGCSEPPADEAQCNSAVGYVEDQRAEAASISEPLLSEVEAAKFLGISKMTVLRRRNAGEIGYFRVGFRVLYSKEKHLIPFLKGREK
jgi:excisionase family DNA binding protein